MMSMYHDRLTALEAAVEALPGEAGPIRVLCMDFYGTDPGLPTHDCPALNGEGPCPVCDEYARAHDPAPAG